MGLPLYVAPVESDVRHKPASLATALARSRARGSRTRSTEFLRETRRRAILAATTAVRNRREGQPQEPPSEPAVAHRSSQDRGEEQDEQAWQPPGADPHHLYESYRLYNSSFAGVPAGEGQYFSTDYLPAGRSSTALPVTARDHSARRRFPDGPLNGARYYPPPEGDTDNLLALFSEHWASTGPGTDNIPGSTEDGAIVNRGSGGVRIPATHQFGLDGFADESLSPFATESDTDGNTGSGRAMRFRRRRSRRHVPSLPVGMAYSASGRPTVDWSDNHDRPRSRSPLSSSRVFDNMSHLRGAEVIYPEERTRHTARAERYRTNLLNRVARRSARNTPRAADSTSDAHRSSNISTVTFGPVANPRTDASSQPHLPPFRYIFGSVDGLGDRQRSLSPEGDGVWDTLQTTVAPDPQPPSVSSSFASFASGRVAAENNDGNPDVREPVRGADEGDDDVTMTLGNPPVTRTWPTTGRMPNATGAREGADGALPSPGVTSAGTVYTAGSTYASAGLQEAEPGEDADCMEGSEIDDRRRGERRTEPARHGGMETAMGSNHYTQIQPLLGGRLGYDRPDGVSVSADTPANTANTSHDELAGRSRMIGMQRFVRNLAQRQDIPDEWWAEVGLSRTLSED